LNTPAPLDGLKILVVEDELLVAMDLGRMIRSLGGEVLGPVSTVQAATALLQTTEPNGAVIDVQLGAESSAPIAEDLMAGGVPILLITGYTTEMLPASLAKVPCMSKPYSRTDFRKLMQRYFRQA